MATLQKQQAILEAAERLAHVEERFPRNVEVSPSMYKALTEFQQNFGMSLYDALNSAAFRHQARLKAGQEESDGVVQAMEEMLEDFVRGEE